MIAAAQKANGPASVGALPDLGSNNPYQENAVNEQHRTTAPIDPASFDPLVEAIKAYATARDRVLAMPMTETGKESDEAYERDVLPLFWKIEGLAPTTMAGAALAMRFLQQQSEGGRSALAASLVEGVASFLEGQREGRAA